MFGYCLKIQIGSLILNIFSWAIHGLFSVSEPYYQTDITLGFKNKMLLFKGSRDGKRTVALFGNNGLCEAVLMTWYCAIFPGLFVLFIYIGCFPRMKE